MKTAYFDPKTNKFPYPSETDKHYLEVHKNRGIVFDRNYPYIDRSKGFLFKQGLVRAVLHVLVFPLTRIRLGLRVEGKENLKKHREALDRGVVSCCNHVHMWDYLGIMSATPSRRTNILAWAPNINGENGTLIRMVGGIPIPEGNLRASMTCVSTVRKLLEEDHGWLHIYAEGSMWEYYAPIRPFKAGAAFYSDRCHKPLLPLAYSYREPGWIRKHIFKQIALFTLHIGEPLYTDETLPPEDRQRDLTRRAHEAVCRLAGIEPKDNPYPPVFDGTARRVDYYTDTYGVGYKGSH